MAGAYNVAEITATVSEADTRIELRETGKLKPGSVSFSPVIYGRQGIVKATLSSSGSAAKPRKLKPATRRWIGKEIPVLAG
jgi:hypothetical protein